MTEIWLSLTDGSWVNSWTASWCLFTSDQTPHANYSTNTQEILHFFSRSSKSQVGFQRSGSSCLWSWRWHLRLFSVGDHNVSVFFSSLNTSTVQQVHLVPPDVWRRPTFLKNLRPCWGKDGQVLSWRSAYMYASPLRSQCLSIEGKGFWLFVVSLLVWHKSQNTSLRIFYSTLNCPPLTSFSTCSLYS